MKKRIYQRLFAVLLVFCLVLSLNISVKASPDQDKAGENADRISVDAGLENTDETDLNEGQKEAEAQTHGENAENDASVDDAAVNEENGTQAQKGRASDAGTAEAASLEEDGISPLAANDVTVTVGEKSTITGSGSDYSYNNHQWKISNSSGGGEVSLSSKNSKNVVVTGVAVGTVVLTHTYYDYVWQDNNWKWQSQSETFNVTVARAGTIEAKVYLRYSNEVPDNINQDSAAVDFGPSGNNIPYITVTVDLNLVMEKTTVWTNSNGYRYYSIESDNNDGYPDGGKAEAKTFWDEVIYPAIEENDRQALDNIFGGQGNFIGYVLKIETDGWHIDGVLTEDPPVYVVELYDHTASQRPCLFAISDNDTTLPGVTYEDFKTNLQRVLGGSGYTYVEESTDRIVVQYQKNGRYYKTTIVPRVESTDKYSNNYHVYPGTEKFAYGEVTKDIYYICRLKIEKTEEITGSLTLKKIVKGSGANPQEHFVFKLAASNLTGTYQVVYTGIEENGSIHADSITFNNGEAELKLKNGETAEIQGLPEGITVAVKEEAGAYRVSAKVNEEDTTYSSDNGVNIIITEKAMVEMTNTLNAVPQTGFHMDSLPGIVLVLCVICAGVFYLLMARRKGNFRR